MVFEKIYDPDEKRKKEEALKEALRKEEEQKMQEQKDRLEQINKMRGKIEELRNKINSTKVSDDPKQDNDLKQEPLKKLDEGEGYLKSAEEQIISNNIKDGIGNIDNAQRSIDAASHWLSQYQNKEQSLGMGI